MNKWEVVLGIIEIIIALILIDKYQAFSSAAFILGGYHIGKGLYKSE